MLNVLNPRTNELEEFKQMGSYIYNLVYMQKTNLVNIPAFICIPNDSIYYSLNEDIKKKIWEIISDLKNDKIEVVLASNKIMEIINNVKLSKDYLYELSMCLGQNLGAKTGTSFVIKNCFYWQNDDYKNLISNNEFGSCINVSYESIADAMLYAYSFIYSPKILDFMKKHNFSIDFPKNNIIVQKMIDVDVSCVVYPINKKEDIINERLIVAKIGRNIAGEEKIIEQYHYNVHDCTFYNDNLSEYELLTQKQLQQIMQQTDYISNKLYKNYTIDIKFLISEEKVYVLSVHKNNFQFNERNFIIDSLFVSPRKKNVSSDLTFAITNDYENRCIKELFTTLYEMPEVYEQNKVNLKDLLVFYKNNIYYDTRRASVFVELLPFSNLIYPVWADKLDILINNFRIEHTKPVANIYAQKEKKMLHTIDKNIDKIFDEISQSFEMFDQNFDNDLIEEDLRNLYEAFIGSISPLMAYKYINIVYLYSTLIEFKEHLKENNISQEQIDYIIKDCLSKDPSPLQKEIDEICLLEKRNVGIRNAFLQILSNPSTLNSFLATENDLTNRIKTILTRYGDITPFQDKVESLTYANNPCILINEIINRENIASANYALLFDDNTKKLLEKKNIINTIKKIRQLNSNQNMFEYYEKIYYSKTKKIFMMLGNIYKNKNIFNDVSDIIFLNLDEIFNETALTKQGIIQSRKEIYTLNSRIPSFNQIIFNREKN